MKNNLLSFSLSPMSGERKNPGCTHTFVQYLLLLVWILITLLTSCKDDEGMKAPEYRFTELSGYRGDTLTITTENSDNTTLEGIIKTSGSEFSCPVTEAAADHISFLIPENILYHGNGLPEGFITDGYIIVSLSLVQKDSRREVYETSLKILFNPCITDCIMNEKLTPGDTVTFSGRDLDVRGLFIEFNSLHSGIYHSSAREFQSVVPDSCGNGFISIEMPDLLNPAFNDLYLREYELENLVLMARYPKSMKISRDRGRNFTVYPLRFDSQGRLSYFRFPNTASYNNECFLGYKDENIAWALIAKENGLTQVDSFSCYKFQDTNGEQKILIQGKLYFFSYTAEGDTILTGRGSSSYILNDRNIIINSTFYNDFQSNQIWQSDAIVQITESRLYNSRSNILGLDRKNITAPLQMQAWGQYNDFMELNLVWFPGNVTFIKQKVHAAKEYQKDFDLYYDDHGNVIREECYSVLEEDFGHPEKRILSRITIWEY